MDEIIQHLRQSIDDELLSKGEKRTLRQLVLNHSLTPDQLNIIKSKAYELAFEIATEANYRFVLEWIRNVNSALTLQPVASQQISEAYFSPGETCRNRIIHQINGAMSQIKICVFTISDDKISDAIIAAHKKGKEIQIITDNDKSHDLGSDVERMAKEGLSIKMDNTSNHMHHKFMVIDNKVVLTGSYNWTVSAARYNHENIVVSDVEVKSFYQEFDKLWNEMDSYN